MSTTPMQQHIELMLAALRPIAATTPTNQLPAVFETILHMYARLAVESLPPAQVARLLREIADTIESG